MTGYLTHKTKFCRIVLVVLLILSGLARASLAAQTAPAIAGTWQGTMQIGKGMRIVLRISKGDNAALRRVEEGDHAIVDEQRCGRAAEEQKASSGPTVGKHGI